MPGKHTKLFKRIFHGDFRPADGMDYSRAYKRWMKENYEAHQRFRKTLKKLHSRDEGRHPAHGGSTPVDEAWF